MPKNGSTTRMGRLICSLIVIGVVAVLAAASMFVHERVHDYTVLIYWWIGNAAMLFCMWAFVKGRRFTHLPVARGRIVALVPAHDEDPEELNACVWSIINQTVPPDEIHVIDDGSKKRPVLPWHHPKVFWHYKGNGGKRSAQIFAIDALQAEDWDYVLTVDGDSVLDSDAVEHQLRAFSNPKVQATTGMVLVRNESTNFLTRLADINIGTSCVMMRASRSLLGTLETTSGALAMYRAEILFDNRDAYLTSGTYGDDRCLAMYSAMRGEVVGVNEAVVWSSMPTTAKATFRQRERWSKSWWCMVPFVLTHMQKFRQIFFPIFGLMQLLIAPITIGYLLYATVSNLFRGVVNWLPLLVYVTVYMAARYGSTALYLVERPGMTWTQKLWRWVLLTPAESIYNLGFLNPTKYLALWRLGDHSWGTHEGGDHGHVMGRGKAGRPKWANGLMTFAGGIYGFAILAGVLLSHDVATKTDPLVVEAGGNLPAVLDIIPGAPWEPRTPDPTPSETRSPSLTGPKEHPDRTQPRRPSETPTSRPTTRPAPRLKPPSIPSRTPSAPSASRPPVIVIPPAGPSGGPSGPSGGPLGPSGGPSQPGPPSGASSPSSVDVGPGGGGAPPASSAPEPGSALGEAVEFLPKVGG
jgi:hyaluronan synthase